MPRELTAVIAWWGLCLAMGFPGAAAAQDQEHDIAHRRIAQAQADGNLVKSITIAMESYQFTPSMIELELGKTVELVLKNESFLVPHNFLLDGPDGTRLVDLDVDSGETVALQFTPNLEGTHTFYCDKELLFFPNHRDEGMEGTLVVH